MSKIKICGITNKIDAVAAADLGVDMIGFVFYKGSKRYIEPKLAEDITNELPPSVARVGVFVNEDKDRVLEIAENTPLDILQFHGDEAPGYCKGLRGPYRVIKAFRVKDRNSLTGINDYDVDYYMLDSYREGEPGGTGRVFDRQLLKSFEFLKPVILSGGLTPDNVASAIREIVPYGVDVSSGVEKSPGKKDEGLMKAFVEEVRKAV